MALKMLRTAGVAAAVIFLAGTAEAQKADAPLGVGNHAPDIVATDISGRPVSLRWPLKEQTLKTLFFFDIHSAEGIRGLTFFDRAYREAHDFGLDIIAIEASGAGREDLQAAMDRYRSVYSDPSFPVIADTGGEITARYGFTGLPRTVLVERHGVVLKTWKGFSEEHRGLITERYRSYLHLPERILAGADAGGGASPGAADESAPQRILFDGDSVAPFSVTDVDGRLYEFSWDSEGEQIVIVYLWNDPCRPCIRGMLYLDQIYRRALDMGIPLQVLAVEAGGLPPADVVGIVRRLGQIYDPPSFPVIAGSGSDISSRLGWDTLPSTYIIDNRGLLLSHSEGFDKGLAGEWIGIIESQISRARGVLGTSIE